jgi:hypothetical protein
MKSLLLLLFAATFPVALGAFLLWLTRLEDTLPRSVQRARRTPDPAPILRIPVQRQPVTAVPEPQPQPRPQVVVRLIPAQRTSPVGSYTPVVSRSDAVSLGGRTKR